MSAPVQDAIAAPWSGLVEQLHQFAHAHADDRLTLWIDRAQQDCYAGHPLVEERRIAVPIRHSRFDPALAPYLVPLQLDRSADADLLRDSVALAWSAWDLEQLSARGGQPVCGWVSTPDPQALARHWGVRCHVHVEGDQARLLRFQDPGVREWLWAELDAGQRDALLGNADRLFSLGRARQLLSQHAGEDREVGPLTLDARQWARVNDYANVHAAWIAWRTLSDAAAARQADGWERAVLSALADATAYGVRDDIDRELFALHALQLGPQFHQLKQFQDVWQQTRAGEFYGSAVEEVTGYPADQIDRFILAA